MQITVTFRHVEPTPALRAARRGEARSASQKYLRRPIDAHVILSVAKERHIAEITLKADHVTMIAKEETHDLYSAIDLAVDKLEHQAQKLKAKREGPQGRRRARGAARRRGAADGGRRRRRRAARVDPSRSASPAKPMSRRGGASSQLERSRDEFLVFRNAADPAPGRALPAQGRQLRADRAGGAEPTS